MHGFKAFGGELDLMWLQISNFPQSVLTAITLAVEWSGDGGARALASGVNGTTPLLISHHHPTGDDV